MPLRTAEDPLELKSWDDIPERFVIFFSSRNDDGKMWCPVSTVIINSIV